MQQSSALVIGEALIDIVVTGDVVTGDVVTGDVGAGRVGAGAVEQNHPGGSPFNVAITLGRLGDDVTLLTAIGDDERGAEITGRLDASNVRLAPESRRSGPTSTARAHLQPDGSARYAFDIAWELPESLSLAPSSVTHAGSIALFLEPGASRVAQLLRERSGDSLITLDPNIRTALVGERAAALQRFEALLPDVDLVKLSDEDAAWLYPDVPPTEVLSRLVARGPGLAVMTLGADGSLLASPAALVEVPTPPTEVADTIGAGDAFMGALIHRLLTTSLGRQLHARSELWGEELSALGTFASNIAAITVSREGADPPRLDELGPSPH